MTPRLFPESGFAIFDGAGWRVVLSCRSGGAVAVQWSGGSVRYDLGWAARLAGGRRVATAHWQPAKPESGNSVRVAEVPFERVSDGLPLVRWMVPFQIVVSLLGAGVVAERFQAMVKRRMIRPRRPVGLVLDRTVECRGDLLTITDRIAARPDCPRIDSIARALEVPFHTPSGRQDPGAPLWTEQWDGQSAAAVLRENRVLEVVGRCRIGADGTVVPEP